MTDASSDASYAGSDYSDDFDNISLDDYSFDDVSDLPPDHGLNGVEKGSIKEGEDDFQDNDQDDTDVDNKIYPESPSAEEIVVSEKNIGDAAFQSVATTKDIRSVVIADSMFQACNDQGPSVDKDQPASDERASKWGKELKDFDHLVSKCIENEKRRLKEGSLITSCIAKENRHRRAILERQLEVAVNQINSYRKENAYLTRKIDSSAVYAELERCRGEIQAQQIKIKDLQEENRSLQRVRIYHEKSLLKIERENEKPLKEESRQRQKKLIESKIKSLKNQLITYQARDRLQYKENVELKEKNMKLQVKIQAYAMSQSVATEVKHGSVHPGDIGVGESAMSMELPSVNMSDDYCSSSVASLDDGSLEHLQSENNRLKSIVSSQRTSFKQQLTTLRAKLEKSLQKRRELEEELTGREKEMKVQLLALRELNNTCDELMRTNVKLREASMLYNRQSRRAPKEGPLSLINARPPTTPKAPAPSPSNSARARRALLTTDEDTGTGGNFTFMTSEQE